ncbi:MAG: enoyl-CoA hydratase/isomerase family protein [Acidobacteria bacterium]|nr:enoyl-CoA hydratase/isomerase family protein [Acidobacteriota bacterium]
MAHQTLIVRREQAVEYVTLNRPDVRNAFDERTIAELSGWADQARAAAAAGALRAVVLAGAGPAFCAGADLAWMRRAARFTEAENLADARAAARLFAALDDLPVALVGRIHGAAIGGGAGLAAVCDIVVAEEAAAFAFAEVRLGIIPAVIAPYIIAKIGPSAARALFLTGARFSAARAQQIGLVHEVAARDDLDRRVGEVVGSLLQAGPEAVAAAKTLVARLQSQPGEPDPEALTAGAIARRRASAEGREGIAAFLEKRKPSWAP